MHVYLSNHTITRPHPAALNRLLVASRDMWGATDAPPSMGQDVHPFLLKHLKDIFQELGAHQEDQFFFCSSGVEAINAVFFFHQLNNKSRRHILTSPVENAPTLLGLKRWITKTELEIFLPLNSQGQVTASCVEEAITDDTSLVSLSWASPLTGVIHPIGEIAEVCRSRSIPLHVDASTVIGKVFFRFEDMNIDYLTFDGSLMHAPQQTGGLFIKKDHPFHPLNVGNTQENVAGIAALSAALVESSAHFEHLNLETARLRDLLERGIQEQIPQASFLFKDAERLPNCSLIAFPGVESEALLYLLNRKNVYPSIGGGRIQKLSQILKTCGVPLHLAHCALSFSLSYETRQEEIEYAIQAIVQCVNRLSRCSVGIKEFL